MSRNLFRSSFKTTQTFWQTKWSWIWGRERTAKKLMLYICLNGLQHLKSFWRRIGKPLNQTMFRRTFISGLIWYLASSSAHSKTTMFSILALTKTKLNRQSWTTQSSVGHSKSKSLSSAKPQNRSSSRSILKSSPTWENLHLLRNPKCLQTPIT